MYEGMLPKEPKKGYRGYYPVTNKQEWEDLPDLYKTMEWEPVKDPHNNNKLSAIDSVIFDVTYMTPYEINAKVYVHPSEVQKILFCSFKDKDCHLYSVCGIELQSGTRLGAKWVQDSTSGAFAIVYNGNYVGQQGGFMGFIPERIKKMEDGTFKYDWSKNPKKVSHYALLNPFRNEKEHVPLTDKIKSASVRAENNALQNDKRFAFEDDKSNSR